MANQKPMAEVKTGSIKAIIWKNAAENGATFNVTFDSLHKEGDKWKRTSTLGRDHLLLLAKVADQTHTEFFNSSRRILRPNEPPAFLGRGPLAAHCLNQTRPFAPTSRLTC